MRPGHEMEIRIECNEENTPPEQYRAACIVGVAVNLEGVPIPIVHGVNPVDMWGAIEVLRRVADEMYGDFFAPHEEEES